MLTFVEAFKIMGIIFLAMIPMVIFLKDSKRHSAPKAPLKAKDSALQPSEVEEPVAEFLQASGQLGHTL